MNVQTVRDISVSGKRVLVRVDFNVPLNKEGNKVTDDSRILASLPTVQYLIGKGARVILVSHLGRPKGKPTEGMRMTPVAKRLSEILGKLVKTASDCIGPEAEKAAEGLKNGDVLLLENVRFHKEEEENNAEFAKALSKLADIYVDDAFGTAHRAHASVVGITKYLPSVAGLLMEKEIDYLGNLLKNPAHPFTGLLGGAKISDKVGMLENIMGKVDYIMVGGGMAATFLKAKGYEVGKSLIETDMLGTAAKLMKKASQNGVKLELPVDVVVADEPSSDAKVIKTVPVDNIPPDLLIVDIGEKTVKNFEKKLRQCKTVFWNGPMGIYETPEFAKGTREIAQVLAELSDASTIIGGGSTAEAVNEMKFTDKMTFVSTGGGASLNFLSGEKLPGIEALQSSSKKPVR